jgi:kinesin family protein 4/21/27
MFLHVQDVDNEQLFSQAVKPLVSQVFEGFNATILTYGQTGTGKTYTLGTGITKPAVQSKNRGIIQRVLEQIFEKMGKLSETRKFLMNASFLEIYNEKLSQRPRGLKSRDTRKRQLQPT